ncbi:DUF2934 domain-containing protein [Teichococcus oryzae]|uniref:DUF2934 domain-containing protein n=1 Tax=Teichococcus oryzae TaxID=1608942 RepID=UPI001F4FA6C6|nr:DUF2934 domain-containing protein [Pseudoroseomonas oryzae]
MFHQKSAACLAALCFRGEVGTASAMGKDHPAGNAAVLQRTGFVLRCVSGSCREEPMQDDEQDRIRQRAHAIWEQQGRPEGRDADHWRQAEQEAGSAGQQPATAPEGASSSAGLPLNPGDDAAPGTPGTGEDVCPECQGSGRVANGACRKCGGTGIVIKGMAGG